MGKGSGVWLGKEGEGVGPNRPAEGDDGWKGAGKVGHAGWQEVGRGDGVLLGRSIEIECTSWGEVGRYDGDLVGRSIELDGTG